MNFSEWFKTMLAGFVGTAIGIVITFGTQTLIERQRQQESEKLSAMMVLSNLNDYIESLRWDLQEVEQMDSVFSYVASLDPECLEQADTLMLARFFSIMPSSDWNIMDKTAERIFSSSFAVWENIASPAFISNVGRCFSLIDRMESMRQDMVDQKLELFKKVYVTGYYTFSSNYDIVRDLLESAEVRYFMEYYHTMYCPAMRLFLSTLEEQNARNREMLGISMEELLEFAPKHDIKHYNTLGQGE